MSCFSQAEVQPGVVVHIDTEILRTLGGSFTNAEKKNGVDRAVYGPHYFLVLSVSEDTALAVPLFSNLAPGSERLDESMKSGLADKWIGETSFFSRFQHWKIPVSAIEAASGNEEAVPANRRRYAAQNPSVLAVIGSWQAKNRCDFRAP
jgi:hypothetical protein